MSTVTAATTSPTGESCRPSWVLLHIHAHVRENRNHTTADGSGRNKERICASLFRERPPLPSNLYVYCPDHTFGQTPYVLSMVDDLILFHAYIGPAFPSPTSLKSDFFIYRADPKRPSLKLLPHPQGQVKRYDPVGIFPRGDDHYTIAALLPRGSTPNHFLLHLFDSETEIWSLKKLSVESPQKEFPVEIPIHINQIFIHNTSTVITLGGTIGWVDLWRGIVFCDMLSEKHTLRGVPLPLPPIKYFGSDYSSEMLGLARRYRGITFLNGCLRLVELDFDFVQVVPRTYDEETGWACCQTENWTITTWINKKMSDSYDDWHVDSVLQASDIILGDHSESELPLIDLQNLFVSDPVIGMNDGDGDIVYLTARVKFMHAKSWVLAIDMRNQKVQSVVMSSPLPPKMPRIDANYCTCSISK